MKRIALIHYQPLELYPPVMNFIDTGRELQGYRLDVYSTYNPTAVATYVPQTAQIRIHRYGARKKKSSAPGRAWHYFRYYFLTLLSLIVKRPSAVFYYETISSFPALVYKRFFNPSCRLLIHYHEYMTPDEYQYGMKLIRWFHGLEKKSYPRAEWLSHTNDQRMQQFLQDQQGIRIDHRYILPNYPPASWYSGPRKQAAAPCKAVYVGAFSLETMYVKEFADWVLQQKGTVTWEIYSTNVTAEAAAFIGTLPSDIIKLHAGIPYSELPSVLKEFDLGVILYKGHIPNWVMNAPNKLFEYMACGLDVWFPVEMKGSLPFVTKDGYPKVLALDFQRLNELDKKAILDHSSLEYRQTAYFCESEYRPLWNRLVKPHKSEE